MTSAQVYYLSTTFLYIVYNSGILAGLTLLQIVWSRVEGAWRGWRAQRRLNVL